MFFSCNVSLVLYFFDRYTYYKRFVKIKFNRILRGNILNLIIFELLRVIFGCIMCINICIVKDKLRILRW